SHVQPTCQPRAGWPTPGPSLRTMTHAVAAPRMNGPGGSGSPRSTPLTRAGVTRGPIQSYTPCPVRCGARPRRGGAMSRSVIVFTGVLAVLLLGCARSTDDAAPAGYSVLRQALEHKLAEVCARDNAT